MRTQATIVLVAAVFGVLWLVVHPALPQLPTGDIFTSLGVARHLARGEGLINDTVYPLFTAYPWGQTVPQPLVHRPPGLAVLLLPACWLADGDPARAEALVQPVMVVLMGVIALVGLLGLRRQHCLAGGGAWLLLLLINPLMALAVSWGWSEIPGSLLLLGLWLLVRNRLTPTMSVGATVLYAALAGALAMVRSDLLWAPVLWWIIGAVIDPRRRYLVSIKRTALAAVIGLAIIAPWYMHVARHTGAPLANPLVEAVQLDLSEEWWDYPLLRSRTPVPLAENLRDHAWPSVRKTAVGIRSYLRTLGLWLPWMFWFTAVGIWSLRTLRRLRRGHGILAAIGPPGYLAITVVLMVLQYAFFSQETRHMLPVMPLFALEGVVLCHHQLRRLGTRWQRGLQAPWQRGIAMAAVAWVFLQISPTGLGGEGGNVETAKELEQTVAEVSESLQTLPPGPVFADNAVVPWRLDRACVWSPYDDRIENEIRAAIPEMRDARWVRIMAPMVAPE